MLKLKKYTKFYCLAAVILAGCGGPPDGVLGIDEMKVALFHHTMAEDFLGSYVARDTTIQYDSAQNAIYRSVLRLHGIDSATFYRSLSYYQEDIERFRILMDSTYAYGIREREHWTLVKEAEQERLNALADTARTDTIKPGGMPADSVRADTIRPDTGKLLPVN